MITIVAPLYKYSKGKLKELCKRNKTVSWEKPLFWKQEVLGNNVIALDISRRKLLYFNQVNNNSSCLIINLKDVKNCKIKKQYHGINACGLLQRKLQYYLKSILLYFSFKDSNQAIALSFYDEQKNNKEETEYLEVKAKEWQAIISGLIARERIVRA